MSRNDMIVTRIGWGLQLWFNLIHRPQQDVEESQYWYAPVEFGQDRKRAVQRFAVVLEPCQLLCQRRRDFIGGRNDLSVDTEN